MGGEEKIFCGRRIYITLEVVHFVYLRAPLWCKEDSLLAEKPPTSPEGLAILSYVACYFSHTAFCDIYVQTEHIGTRVD